MLDEIKLHYDQYEHDFGLFNDHIKWLIEKAEKVERLEEAIDYVLTAKPTHYDDIKNMLEDFKYIINSTLQGK